MNMQTSTAAMATKAKKQPHAVDAYVGERIRARRKQLGLSQEKLADRIGLTFQQVQKYEKGTNRCGPSRLAAIAMVLEAPIVFFFPDDLNAIARPAEPSPLAQQMTIAIARMRSALEAAEAVLSTKH